MTIADKLARYFTSRGCDLPDIAILQPADPFLETAGEDLRRRVFITGNEHGDALCLRPEFTIPLCLYHLAEAGLKPRRYGCLGPVFRQWRNGRGEFLQGGIEDFGRSDVVNADIDCLADAHGCLEALGAGTTHTLLGDQSVFEAVVAALGLPQGWQTRLVRAFGDEQQLATHVSRLTNGASKTSSSMESDLLALINAGKVAAVEKAVADKMATASLPVHGGRTAVEIARRAVVKARLAAVRLDKAHAAALKDFLAIDVSADKAAERLVEFERIHALDLGAAKAGLIERLARLGERGLPLGSFRYKASFGRKLDYYSGLLFEIYVDDNLQPVVGGGRYDRLMTLLGSDHPVPAVGFAIWPGRLAVSGDAG
ncbi:MAG: ATP phosphoribosyltransferase regulatory subunit [Rhodobacteraceae bacterium]|nr:ATP phosphoribosyltransferase regulatory subunit [Paracoccaceae bacterium]